MVTRASLRCVSVLVACLVSGCGGAATDVPPADDLATVKVLVVENDGQTTNLEGHVFTVLQTEETAASGADGVVPLGPIPPGTFVLRLEGAAGLQPLTGEALVDAPDPGDDEYADAGQVCVEQVQAREQIEIRIHLANAAMQCVRVSRQWRGESDVEIMLERTDANDDPDMTGELELERDVFRQSFQVRVGLAEPGLGLELVVVDPAGVEESQGMRTVDALGAADWTLDTSDGDRLPFGVDDVRELEDHGVEVRDALTGVALLVANVPEVPPPAGGDDEDHLVGRALLTPVEENLEGYVEINSREDGACESFHMEVQGLAVGRAVEFLLEDPDDADAFLPLGTRVGQGSLGKAHLGVSTSTGDELPAGVASVAELVGLRVEVRDVDTVDLLLHGIVPELIAD